MHKTFLTALVTAAILMTGMLARADATAAAASAAVGGARAALVREAAIVCGGNGCNSVQTKAQKRRKFLTLGHG